MPASVFPALADVGSALSPSINGCGARQVPPPEAHCGAQRRLDDRLFKRRPRLCPARPPPVPGGFGFVRHRERPDRVPAEGPALVHALRWSGPRGPGPDAKTLWLCREQLTRAGAVERLFRSVRASSSRRRLSRDGGPLDSSIAASDRLNRARRTSGPGPISWSQCSGHRSPTRLHPQLCGDRCRTTGGHSRAPWPGD